jgi:hypothetical protein
MNTLGRIINGFLWLSDIYLRRNKKNKKIKKQYFFIFLLQPGIEPTTNKKMEKAAVSRCAFPRPPLVADEEKYTYLKYNQFLSLKIFSLKNPSV